MAQESSSDQSVAILGLGIMGSAFARNLIARDFTVHGFDPDHETASSAAKSGILIAKSAVEAAQDCDVILTSLPSESALSSTVDLLVKNQSPTDKQRILVELSTLSLDCKKDACDQLVAAGIEMLDCPVSGTGAQAQTKDIVLYASGDEIAFADCQTVFDAIARESFYLGALGNGTRMKFIANLLVAIHNVATAEAINLARQSGLDPQRVYDVISSGAGTSRIFELRGPMMVRDSYDPATMKLDVWQKDMSLIQHFAKEVGVTTPLFEATRPLYEQANALGMGELDTAAVFKILAET
ncbi:MAG: NAD(P)-dependent oxidoreductase [Rhodospirillaceae bacterium]|jgi:L-threonate 2-dehydrogenase|nr:NAD(P)-dependent oxidoreductase [Rhodospirillaceae bacterium]